MADSLTAGGAGTDGTLSLLNAANEPTLEANVATTNPNVKRTELKLGATGAPGLLRIKNNAGKPIISASGSSGSVNIGGTGGNGSLTISASDNDGSVQINTGKDGPEIFLGAANKPARIQLTTGGNPGPTIDLDGSKNALLFQRKGSNTDNIVEVNGNGFIRVGGFGTNGQVSVRGADGKPLAELLAFPNEGVLGLGQPDRPGRISVYNGKGEAVRIDGATGDVVLGNADCAEEFDISDADIEPGTVVVLTDDGAVAPSEKPYDRRVAGVISGAGSYKPALILDRRETGRTRAPVALMGKVYCLADATEDPIEVGDLLATSETPGHAMRVSDPANALGAVLGKALSRLSSGRGLVPILVTLQ